MNARSLLLLLASLAALLLLPGCAFHTTAKRWNGRVGGDGKPVYYVTSTKVGVNLLVVVPFLGDTDLDGMVGDLTEHIAESDGDQVRIVQGSTENYWYGFPPFTWILTPVVSTLSADYQPSKAVLITDEAEGLTE